MAAPAAPQFQTYKSQVPLGQGQRLGFTAGKGYYARGPLAQAAVADPYTQLTGYQPLTAAQIQKQAQGEISPLIQAITGQANTLASNEGAQIKALTQEYANELGQMNFASPYQQAEPQQAAVDAALQQSLTGAGSGLASGLSDRLSQLQGTSGQAAVDQASGALSSQGASSGNTALANGSAALSNLIANAAAGGEFGMKLPGIAKLSGLQGLGQVAGQQSQAVNQGILQAEGQLPSIIQDLTANNETGLSNAVSAQQKQNALNFENWVKSQTVKQGAAKVGVAQRNANTSATRAANTAAAQADTSARGWANIGISQQKVADAEAKAAKVRKAGGLTAGESATIRAKAEHDAETMYYGVAAKTRADGSVSSPAISGEQYGQAYRTLLARYPSLGPKAAIGILNTLYAPGEGGRPAGKGVHFVGGQIVFGK